MRSIIINRFSPSSVNYEEWLSDIVGEFIMITKQEHLDGFSDFFAQKVGFENFDRNEAIYSYITDLHKFSKVDNIIATHEFDLVKVGQLREHLGIDGQNSVSATAFRDKVIMKESVNGAIKVPHFRRINNVFDLLKFVEMYGYPLVLKPVDGAGSIGLNVLYNKEELNLLLEQGLERNLEVESYVEGQMYCIDGIYMDKELLLSRPSKYVNGCLAFKEDNFSGAVMISDNNGMYCRLNEAVHKILNALPTPKHAIAFHAEIFHTPNDELILCEIASRVGGGLIVEGIEYGTGIDILRESVRSQCGGTINYKTTKNQLTGFCVIPPKAGVLRAIEGELPFDWVVKSIIKNDMLGKKFEKAIASSSYFAMVLVSGENEEEIEVRLNLAYQWINENVLWDIEEEQVATVI